MQDLDPHTDPDPNPDPDPLVTGWIPGSGLHTKIRNTADENLFPVSIVPVDSIEMSDSDPRQSHTDRNTRLPVPYPFLHIRVADPDSDPDGSAFVQF
jgi:hypothetical protein